VIEKGEQPLFVIVRERAVGIVDRPHVISQFSRRRKRTGIGDTNTTVKDHEMLAARCDEMLCEINCEYRSKRASGRLGAIEIEPCGFKEFVNTNPAWETQFKFLPLQLRHPVNHVSS